MPKPMGKAAAPFSVVAVSVGVTGGGGVGGVGSTSSVDLVQATKRVVNERVKKNFCTGLFIAVYFMGCRLTKMKWYKAQRSEGKERVHIHKARGQ
jgi:hypothetical protein